MRSSRKVADLVYKDLRDEDNPLKSKYANKRVWADGLFIKIELKSMEEFELALEEALDRLPSLQDTLIYFDELVVLEGRIERQFRKFKRDRLAITKTVLSKRNLPCTVLEKQQGMAILACTVLYNFN